MHYLDVVRDFVFSRLCNLCREAIERARIMDINPQHRWPNGLGTHVYRLVDRIIIQNH